jgi:hypothetical protein
VLITLIGKIFLFFFEGRRDNHKNKPRARSPLPLPSRPGEFHPESLTDPDVNLSSEALLYGVQTLAPLKRR